MSDEESCSRITPELVRRAQAGDEAAREHVLGESRQIARQTAWKVLGRRAVHDIDDIVGDAYIRVLTSLPRVTKPAAFPNFVYIATRNLCLNLLRSRKKTHLFPDLDAAVFEMHGLADEQFRNEQNSLDLQLEEHWLWGLVPTEAFELLLLRQQRLTRAEILKRLNLTKEAYYTRLRIAECYLLLAQATMDEVHAKDVDATRRYQRILAILQDRPRKTLDERLIYAGTLMELFDLP